MEADVQALKDVLAKYPNAEDITEAQIAEIKAAKEKVMESSQQLFAKMYEQVNQQNQAGPQAGPQGTDQAGPTPEGYDDVVDGDYKEV